jgi:hypothetical protein
MPRKKPVSLRARVEALEKKLAREIAKRKRAEKALAESAGEEERKVKQVKSQVDVGSTFTFTLPLVTS